MRVHRVWAWAAIAQKPESIAVEYKTTFGIIDQAALALGNEPALHAL
jgi:hypothetical protein